MAEARTCDICTKFIVEFRDRYNCKVRPVNTFEETMIDIDLCKDCYNLMLFAVKNLIDEMKGKRNTKGGEWMLNCECGCRVSMHDEDGVCRVCCCEEMRVREAVMMVVAA